MRYIMKKLTFFLLALLAIPNLFIWFFFYLDSALDIGDLTGIDMAPSTLFHGEAIISTFFYSVLFLALSSIIFLIFYRRECRIWPKLFMLFTGTVSTFTSLDIEWPIYTLGEPMPASWTMPAIILILLLIAAIALAAIVWLIAAMVKYPKPEPNAV